MRRRRRFLALLFIFSAFATPLGFFYYTIANESKHKVSIENWRQMGLPTAAPHVPMVDSPGVNCSSFPQDVSTLYPDCLTKMNWIRSGWKTHRCYADNNVDGTECSFRFYLSHVENYCPPMEEVKVEKNYAKMNPSIRRLLPILANMPHYMATRINRMWTKWKEGAHEVYKDYQKSMSGRKRLNVLVFIGFLANEKKLNLAEKSSHGGPLGELLQWSDLLSSLSIIGHHLEVSIDKDDLRSIITKYDSRGPCKFVDGTRQQLDIIFTDIMGLNILRQKHRQFLMNNKCRIRLLDSFGTHAEFATKSYFLKHKFELSGNYSTKNPWGGHGLDLRKHWTFYPHSDDNTFLGFVIDTEGMNRSRKKGEVVSLVYGKEQYMWKEAERPIRVLKKLTEVHATVADLDMKNENTSSVFQEVTNHGFLNSEQISQLLDKTTIFFGLGFPLEGPAPLEAIAHGAVFINAKFREPKSRKNYRFLSEKPTLREWTSQNPYMEMIGEPHVITVDIDDEKELEKAIKRAITLKPSSKIPFEFSPAGMLLRVALLLENQNSCDSVPISKMWPPATEMRIITSSGSCEEACHRKDLLCEPSYFPIVNTREVLKRHHQCSDFTSISSPMAPFNCTLQQSASLFSCASRPSEHVSRLCPCRDHLPEQHAICKKCL